MLSRKLLVFRCIGIGFLANVSFGSQYTNTIASLTNLQKEATDLQLQIATVRKDIEQKINYFIHDPSNIDTDTEYKEKSIKNTAEVVESVKWKLKNIITELDNLNLYQEVDKSSAKTSQTSKQPEKNTKAPAKPKKDNTENNVKENSETNKNTQSSPNSDITTKNNKTKNDISDDGNDETNINNNIIDETDTAETIDGQDQTNEEE